MALFLRTGDYGSYWGNDFNSSNALNTAQMEVNALYFARSMRDSGWTLQSIAGMLGNMQVESSINPGRWEGDNVGTGPGYGLVQWTPFTNYTSWATTHGYLDPSLFDGETARINFELANNLQWIPTLAYPESFEDFKNSTSSPFDLALMFLANYERPADPDQPIRGTYANAWYNYLLPFFPTGDIKKHKFKWVLYSNKIRERNNV